MVSSSTYATAPSDGVNAIEQARLGRLGRTRLMKREGVTAPDGSWARPR